MWLAGWSQKGSAMFALPFLFSDQDFDEIGMAEESARASGCTIGTGLEDHDEVVSIAFGQGHLFGEEVQRGA